MNKASELLWQYQAEEKEVERAEEKIKEARARQLEIFKTIQTDNELMDALQSVGVIDTEYLMTIESKNSTAIDIRPAPVFTYSLSNEDLEVPF